MKMSYTTYIRNFDFADPDFDSIPQEILRLDPKTIPPMERAILNGIKFQMNVSKYNAVMQKVNLYINKHAGLNRIMAKEHRTIPAFPGINPAYSWVLLPIIGFLLLSTTYYLNVNLNLGMNFLTNLFA